MAAIFEPFSGTSTARQGARMQSGTAAVAIRPEDETEPTESGAAIDAIRPGPAYRTLPQIAGGERGDLKARDAAGVQTGPALSAALVGETAEQRREMAGRLCELMTRVVSNCGRVRMAADIELLKRELARCHEVLGQTGLESDYVSIITLVEASIASMDWKHATKDQLRRVNEILTVGRDTTPVTFDHFNKALKVLRGHMLPTGPSFEIDVEESGTDAD